MDKKLVSEIKTVSKVIKLYRVSPPDDLQNHSEVVKADGSDVIIVGTEAEATCFSSCLSDVIDVLLDIFPEVPIDEVILDYGIASVELIDRVGRLRERGIPITIVDIFEFLSPISISSQCAHRVLRGECNEDF